MPGTPVDDAKYINLRTYKRSGDPVDTPVWQAPMEGKLYVFTDGTSYKVKRLRRNPKVQVARCDIRGGLLGPWLEGTCRLVDAGEDVERRAYAALNRKYGLVMRIGTLLSTISGRVNRRQMLEIALGDRSSA